MINNILIIFLLCISSFFTNESVKNFDNNNNFKKKNLSELVIEYISLSQDVFLWQTNKNKELNRSNDFYIKNSQTILKNVKNLNHFFYIARPENKGFDKNQEERLIKNLSRHKIPELIKIFNRNKDISLTIKEAVFLDNINTNIDNLKCRINLKNDLEAFKRTLSILYLLNLKEELNINNLAFTDNKIIKTLSDIEKKLQNIKYITENSINNELVLFLSLSYDDCMLGYKKEEVNKDKDIIINQTLFFLEKFNTQKFKEKIIASDRYNSILKKSGFKKIYNSYINNNKDLNKTLESIGNVFPFLFKETNLKFTIDAIIEVYVRTLSFIDLLYNKDKSFSVSKEDIAKKRDYIKERIN